MTENRRAIIEKITKEYDKCPYPSPRVSRRGKPRLTVDMSALTAEDIRCRDEFYMSCAIKLARLAAAHGEIPVGALMVCGGEIIAADFNGRESEKNALYHAELAVIDEACRVMGGWRLPGCELYVTLEPCVMCAGGIISARVPRTVYGAADIRAGAMGSTLDVTAIPTSHRPTVVGGVLEEECLELLRDFFAVRRTNK